MSFRSGGIATGYIWCRDASIQKWHSSHLLCIQSQQIRRSHAQVCIHTALSLSRARVGYAFIATVPVQVEGCVISNTVSSLSQLSTLMYVERLEEKEAVIHWFTVAKIQPTVSVLYTYLTLLPSLTHSSIPIRAHLGITSPAPPPQRNQFRLLLHTVMACWPREMESLQVLSCNLLPSSRRCPLAASQHFLSMPGISAG